MGADHQANWEVAIALLPFFELVPSIYYLLKINVLKIGLKVQSAVAQCVS